MSSSATPSSETMPTIETTSSSETETRQMTNGEKVDEIIKNVQMNNLDLKKLMQEKKKEGNSQVIDSILQSIDTK